MRDADDAKNRDAWKKMLASRGKRDLYVIREAGRAELVQGTVLERRPTTGTSVNFEKEDGDEGDAAASRARPAGCVFNQPPPATVPPTLCKVIDVFGNTLDRAGGRRSRPSGVTVTTVAGVTVKYPSTAALVEARLRQGNVAYLSDLDPQVDAPEIPPDEKGLRLERRGPYLRDRALSGEPLKLGSEIVPEGPVRRPGHGR